MVEMVSLIKDYGLVIVALALASYGAYLNRVHGETEKGFRFLAIGIGVWILWVAVNWF